MIGENMKDGRHWSIVGGLSVATPATLDELRYVGEKMRPEEAGEIRDCGESLSDRISAFRSMRFTAAIYHRGELLAIGGIHDVKSGVRKRLLLMERTVHALEKGHRFTWLKSYGPLSEWIHRADEEFSDRGELVALSPTDLPRALDVYKYAGAEVAGTVLISGREYWILRVGKTKRW